MILSLYKYIKTIELRETIRMYREMFKRLKG